MNIDTVYLLVHRTKRFFFSTFYILVKCPTMRHSPSKKDTLTILWTTYIAILKYYPNSTVACVLFLLLTKGARHVKLPSNECEEIGGTCGHYADCTSGDIEYGLCGENFYYACCFEEWGFRVQCWNIKKEIKQWDREHGALKGATLQYSNFEWTKTTAKLWL